MTSNIHHFPLERVSADRYDQLKHEVQTNQYDVIGLTETNYNWSRLTDTDQLHHQTRGWWKNKSITNAWLQSNTLDARQFGGTSTIITNDLTSYITAKGVDERRMGRWSWYTISDPGKIISTTIITLYYPRHSTSAGSVNGQQLTKLRQDAPHQSEDALAMFKIDLHQLIQTKQRSDHQIIVMGDFNQNTQCTKSPLVHMLKSLGLRDPIEEKYGGVCPATWVYGSKPIDGIFCSKTLCIIQGGHRPGNISLSDHKLIWIDLHKSSLIGDADTVLKPIQRKLQSHHPTIRKKFNKT